MAESEKLLNELRVTELKAELDKRGLDKNGIKVLLSDRLEKALRTEGLDPLTYKFTVTEGVFSSPTTTPVKNKPEETKSEGESFATADSDTSMTIDMSHAEGDLSGLKEEIQENEHLEDEEHQMEMDATDNENESSKDEEQQLEDPLNETPAEPVVETAKNGDSATHNQAVDSERTFWVRGLPMHTKAADVRELFSEYGKVLRAKIFTSKRSAGKMFGLLTVEDPSMIDKCIDKYHNKQWNGSTITIEKGNPSNMSSNKASAAPAVTPAKKDVIKTPVATKEDRNPEVKKDDSSKPTKSEGKKEKKSGNDNKEKERAVPREADRARSRREPSKRESRVGDSRKTITAARRPIVTSSRSGIRVPAHISSRLSRPSATSSHRSAVTSSSRRPPESYSRSESDRSERDRLRLREEELRRRAAEMELERERERLRAERERIEREKLQLQVMQQKAQLAAYEKAAVHGSSRSHHSESSRHGTSSSTSRRDDRYSSRAGGDSHRSHDRAPPPSSRDRAARSDDRRPPPSSNGDRSRSRHDSHRDTHRETTGHRDSRYQEPRRETRHDAPPTRSTAPSYSSGRSYSSRDPAVGLTGGQNFYGSRESYSTGIAQARDYEHGSRIAPAQSNAWSSGGAGANWSGMATENTWGMKGAGGGGGGTGSSSAWGYGSSATSSNVRIDYDKYHRQRQF